MDTTLTNTLATAPHIRLFLAIRVELRNGGNINLIDGSGYVTFPVDGTPTTFTGSDPVFGTLAAAQSVTERVADSAQKFAFSILPPNENAMSTLNDPLQQGSRVLVWLGAVDDQTGLVIPTPELLWNGRLDLVKASYSKTMMIAEVSTVSAFDRLFENEEGQRLNGEWHRSIWPGESGLDLVYDASSEVHWGVDSPSGGSSYSNVPLGLGAALANRYRVQSY